MPTWTNHHKSKAFEPSVYGVMHFTKFKLACKQVQNKLWMLGILIADHLQNGVEKKSFAKCTSCKLPAGIVRGRLVGIVAAYVWCQEHQ